MTGYLEALHVICWEVTKKPIVDDWSEDQIKYHARAKNALFDALSEDIVGTLRQEYPLLQDKDEGAQERQPPTTSPDPREQVPNLRGLDLGLYKWKPDLQEA